MDPRFEAVHSDIDSSFRCLHFECASFCEDHSWHYHPEYELTWVIRSAGTRYVGDSIQPYVPGDLVLLGPDLPHCWQNIAADDARATPEVVVVQFRMDWLGADFLQLDEARPLRDLLRRACGGLHFPPALAERMSSLLFSLSEQKGLSRLARLLDVLEALSGVRDARPLVSQDYQSRNDIHPVNRSRVEIVQRYVRENIREEICQAQIAARLSMSSPAFSRFFRAATGKTFVGFVNAVRVNEACRLLSGTSRTVTEIAMECGYNNISNFNRQFLALKGMNPGAYRRLLQERANHQLAWSKRQQVPVDPHRMSHASLQNTAHVSG